MEKRGLFIVLSSNDGEDFNTEYAVSFENLINLHQLVKYFINVVFKNYSDPYKARHEFIYTIEDQNENEILEMSFSESDIDTCFKHLLDLNYCKYCGFLFLKDDYNDFCNDACIEDAQSDSDLFTSGAIHQ